MSCARLRLKVLPGTPIISAKRDIAASQNPSPIMRLFPISTAEPESLASMLQTSSLDGVREYLAAVRALDFTIPSHVAEVVEKGEGDLCVVRPACRMFQVTDFPSCPWAHENLVFFPPTDLTSARQKDAAITPASLHHLLNVGHEMYSFGWWDDPFSHLRDWQSSALAWLLDAPCRDCSKKHHPSRIAPQKPSWQVARLLAVSHGEAELTAGRWAAVQSMELRRSARCNPTPSA